MTGTILFTLIWVFFIASIFFSIKKHGDETRNDVIAFVSIALSCAFFVAFIVYRVILTGGLY